MARTQGLAEARMVAVEHPIGGIDEARLLERGDRIVDAVMALFEVRVRPMSPSRGAAPA